MKKKNYYYSGRLLLLGVLSITMSFMDLAFAKSDTDETILAEGVEFKQGTILRTADGGCSLKLQGDGNLISRRKGRYWGWVNWDLEERINWTSGAHDGEGGADYYAILQKDSGNFQVVERNSNQVVWTTHVPPPRGTEVSHELVMNSMCQLRVNRFEKTTSDPEGTDYWIWANIYHSLDNFDADLTWGTPGLANVVGKGEFYTVGNHYREEDGIVCGTGADYCFSVPFSLGVQHDCNIITFVGTDKADKKAVVWSPKVKPPDGTSDCYLLVDSNDVALYAGSFDPTAPLNLEPPGKYWSVPSSFFNNEEFVQGQSTYQVLINNQGRLFLDWD